MSRASEKPKRTTMRSSQTQQTFYVLSERKSVGPRWLITLLTDLN